MKTSFRPCIHFIIIFLASYLFCFKAFSQLSVGIKGGYNQNYLTTNNANRSFTNYESMNGFNISIPLQYKIADWFAITMAPEFVQKNYNQQRSAFFVGVYQNNYNNYIDLPLMGHFMFGGQRLKGFLNAGMYAGYWLSGRVQGVMPNILNIAADNNLSNSVYDYENPYSYNEKYTFNTTKDNRWEAGWIGGLGISYNINQKYQVFTEANILYTFTDQQKNYMINQVPRYNTTYGINAGIMYSFYGRKLSY
jgi:hypothetical protein